MDHTHSPEPSKTDQRRQAFVGNLGRLMASRGLSIRETARRAGLADKKRFYRWATLGISRAAHSHDADLFKLQMLFQLKSFEELWSGPPPVSLEDQLRSAAVGNRDYIYAYKALVIIQSGPVGFADHIRRVIDELYDALGIATDCPPTAQDVLAEVLKRSPEAHRALLARYHGQETQLINEVTELISKGPGDVSGLIISWISKITDLDDEPDGTPHQPPVEEQQNGGNDDDGYDEDEDEGDDDE